VQFDYEPENEDELRIEVGDIVEVIKQVINDVYVMVETIEGCVVQEKCREVQHLVCVPVYDIIKATGTILQPT
jgi:hypothetical protein